jgi:ubiquinone/menaquinone biosynthesis C-methylase UbiE
MKSETLSMEERESLFQRRTQYYLSQGYDRVKAANFVAKCASELQSPALDIGAGKGLLSIAVAKRGIDVLAIDLNEYDLQFANYLTEKENLKDKITFLCLDATSLPFEDSYFKTVVMMDVLHHLQNGEPVLKEMERVLSQDGKMIIAEFDEEGFEIVAKAHQNEGTTHPRSDFTLEKAISILQQCNLKFFLKTNKHFQNVVVLMK